MVGPTGLPLCWSGVALRLGPVACGRPGLVPVSGVTEELDCLFCF